jgi:hypothetical protein
MREEHHRRSAARAQPKGDRGGLDVMGDDQRGAQRAYSPQRRRGERAVRDQLVRARPRPQRSIRDELRGAIEREPELAVLRSVRVGQQPVAPTCPRQRLEHVAQRGLRPLRRRKRQRRDVQDV